MESSFFTVTGDVSSGDPWCHQGLNTHYGHRKGEEETKIDGGPQDPYDQSDRMDHDQSDH